MSGSKEADIPSSEAANGHSAGLSPDGLKFGLIVGTLGVVYGDIGTSPLYAIKECFSGSHAIAVNQANVFGVISLVFWSLVFIVCIKYIIFMLRVDNKGEGGVFALLGLLRGENARVNTRSYSAVVLAGIFGASLLYGDGVITPAISVLSAMEGLAVGAEALSPLVIPLTCIVLFTLFFVQRTGTKGVSRVFGPIMLIWFVALSVLGIRQIIEHPFILQAVNPVYIPEFFMANKFYGMIVLASVVLCITGCEDLYLDLGHFGSRSIRVSWFSVVFPALLLNYFGQGALILSDPQLATNPFYGLVPRTLIYPMVALSTLATVIASQALISGVFSLTQQAIQLGYCPRIRIVHTSSETRGQIYIPIVNYALLIACIGVVLAFKSSSGLAGAYGVAVTTSMTLTSTIYFFALIKVFRWPLWKAAPLVGMFLFFDLAYFGTNLLKLFQGGWFPLAVAIVVMIAMTTWKDGRYYLGRSSCRAVSPLISSWRTSRCTPWHRVMGTAVFLTVSPPREHRPPSFTTSSTITCSTRSLSFSPS
jgi:KUP system potassium uptake protein